MPTIEANKVLRINSAADGLELVSFTASDIGSPISSKGDIIYGDVAGVPERLAIGTVGQILRVAGGVPTWDDDDAATYAVVTTKGDLIVGNAGGAPARLAIGSTGQVLTVAGATATWAANPVNVITTRGDIIVGNSTPIPARLAAGTEGDRLTVNSSGDVVWVGLRSTAARVYRSTDQTITKNTYTKVEAAHETFDYGANYDAVTNYLYTAPVAGVYLVIGQVCWQTVTGAGVYRALIYVDGVAVRESFELLEAADNRYVQVQDLIALTAGQTVGLYCHTNSASNEDVNGGSAATWMSVIRVA
jgi:hypothetical protein